MKYLFYILFGFISFNAMAQQQPLYTQFMYNKAALNPAYAGNDEFLSLTALVRNQWIGLDGAPSIQQINLHTPLFNETVGAGVGLSRYSIGVSDFITLEGQYAYKIPVGNSVLSLGGQLSFRNFSINFLDSRINTTEGISIDGAIGQNEGSKNLLNAGFGAYYSNSAYYFGLSLPRLFKSNLDFDNDIFDAVEVPHFYFMTGIQIGLNEDIDFIPQILVRYLNNAPLDFDINLSLILNQKITTGINYRSGGEFDSFGESLALVFAFQVDKKLQLSMAYDFTLTTLRQQSSGSLELAAKYIFGVKTGASDFFNPRHF